MWLSKLLIRCLELQETFQLECNKIGCLRNYKAFYLPCRQILLTEVFINILIALQILAIDLDAEYLLAIFRGTTAHHDLQSISKKYK